MKTTGENFRKTVFSTRTGKESKERAFSKKVLIRLAEMLKLLKMGDKLENRQKFQAHCQYLLDLGKESKYWGWVELLDVAKRAIAPKLHHPYETTAKLIIKEIKQAEELVKTGVTEKVQVSKQLQNLVPEPRLKPLDIQTIGEELAPNRGEEQQQKTTINKDLWDGKDTINKDLWDGKATINNELTPLNENLFEEEISQQEEQSKNTPESSKVTNVEDLLNLFNEISEDEEPQFLREPETKEQTPTNLELFNDLFDSLEEESREEEEENYDFLNLDYQPDVLPEKKQKLEKTEEDLLDKLATLFDLKIPEEESINTSEATTSDCDELVTMLGDGQEKEEEEIICSFDELPSFDELAAMLEDSPGEEKEETTSSFDELAAMLEDSPGEEKEETTSSFDELAGMLEDSPEEEKEETTSSFDELAAMLEDSPGEEKEETTSSFDELAGMLEDSPEEEKEETTSSFDELAGMLEDSPGEEKEETTSSFDDLAAMLATAHEEREVEEISIDELLGLKSREETQELVEGIKNKPNRYFYEQIEELEELIESCEEFEELEWDKLAAIIDSETGAKEANLLAEEITAIELGETDSESDDLLRKAEVLLGTSSEKLGSHSIIKPSSKRDPKAFEQTMRVSVKQLDNLNNLIGELVVKRNRLEQDQERLRQFLDNLLNHVQNLSDIGGRMHDLYERSLLEAALLASRNQSSSLRNNLHLNSNKVQDGEQGFDALEMDRFTGFHTLSQEMIELIVRVREASEDIQFLVDGNEQVARTLRQVTTQLQEGMNKSRMVTFAQTADRLPRAVRDISRKLNKNADLKVEGREVLIDKMILEHLYNPMTHLVNNAITHGIESPEIRNKQGKNPTGTITVRAFLQGNQTVISVADDGAGIDHERVKTKAIEKGLVTPAEAKSLTHLDIYDFLFHPGFSTKDKADDFAGRGVGLDVVRTSLNEIRGSVSIDSTLGKGTTFNIRLPLTLSICKALCCLSENALIAFPMDGIEDIIEIAKNKVQTNSEGVQCVSWRDTMLPFQNLTNLLSYNRRLNRSSIYAGKKEEELVSIVVLRGAGSLLAIEVDVVLPGEEEIVIKQIEGPVPKPPGIAGATVLGDGRIMPIGDVLELIEIATGRRSRDNGDIFITHSGAWQQQKIRNAEPMVLIVDDSITVREVLSGTFIKAGYRVEQARDGQEAWEKLSSGLICDLVFCDIEMPKMNGLELLSKMQKDPDKAAIPVALLTSRGAERHRKVAAELGASGYFTKPYIETDLLEAANRMIKGEVLLPNSNKNSPTEQKQKTRTSKETQQAKLEPSIQELIVTPQPVNQKAKSQRELENAKNTSHSTKSEQMVLIVDDSVVVREMLSTTFKKAGYQVEKARDGQDAWDKLRGGLPCDIILCDIEMPRMNGLDFLSKIQSDETLAKIPVAMVTSRGADKHRRIAAERGAKAYFTKPYLEDELLKAVHRLIQGELLLYH